MKYTFSDEEYDYEFGVYIDYLERKPYLYIYRTTTNTDGKGYNSSMGWSEPIKNNEVIWDVGWNHNNVSSSAKDYANRIVALSAFL
jgi:hypothetical protein